MKKDNTILDLAMLRIRRIENGEEKIIFYEVHSQRVYYGGYDDYETNNRLPECWMCFPRGGMCSRSRLNNEVHLDFKESPSCHLFWSGSIDAIVTHVGVVGTGVLVASIFFPQLLIFEAPAQYALLMTGVYGTSRSISDLVDRVHHDQSISLGDPEALRQWINMFLGAGSTLTCGISILTKTIGNGRIALNRSTSIFAITVLRHVSVGVNCVGIVSIIAHLVIKYQNNNLELSDLRNFATMILFVANIIISMEDAEKIIQQFANQPERIRDAFNMVRNTRAQSVKEIMSNLTWEEIWNILNSDVVIDVVRKIGLHRITDTLTTVKNLIQRRVGNLVLEIGRCLYHFFLKLINEIREHVFPNFKKWFARSSDLHSYSGTVALEVTDEVNRVVNDIGLTTSEHQDEVAGRIGEMVNDVANETNREFGTAGYAEVCEMICDKLLNTYQIELILRNSDVNEPTSASANDECEKLRIFRDVFTELQDPAKKKELTDILLDNQRQQYLEIRKKLLFHRPIFQTVRNSVFYFETPPANLPQFFHDAARELWNEDKLFSARGFYSSSLENTTFMGYGPRSLCFKYDLDETRNTVFGIVITDEERDD